MGIEIETVVFNFGVSAGFLIVLFGLALLVEKVISWLENK